jgi:hypothetical protein
MVGGSNVKCIAPRFFIALKNILYRLMREVSAVNEKVSDSSFSLILTFFNG